MKTRCLLLLLCLIAAVVPALTEQPGIAAAPGQTVIAFQEYTGMEYETWFLTGKKEYTVQAMMVSKDTSFHNELEVTDYTVKNDGETVILKGCLGEMWASKLSKVADTYTKADGTAVSREDFVIKDRFIDLKTKAEPEEYYAMHVPLTFSVTVETAWGDVLHTNLPNAPHGRGDYLVCRRGGDGEPDLSDVWILNGVLFPEYYDMEDTDGLPAESAAGHQYAMVLFLCL